MTPGQQDTYRQERAKEFWVYIIPHLLKLKRFEPCDEPAVVEMCRAYRSKRLAEALIARMGQLVMLPSKNGPPLPTGITGVDREPQSDRCIRKPDHASQTGSKPDRNRIETGSKPDRRKKT